jgi:zinc protease
MRRTPAAGDRSLWQTPGEQQPDSALRVLDAVLSAGNIAGSTALVQKGLATSARQPDRTEEAASTPHRPGGRQAVADAETRWRRIERSARSRSRAPSLPRPRTTDRRCAAERETSRDGPCDGRGAGPHRRPRAPTRSCAHPASHAADCSGARKYLSRIARVAIRYLTERERPAGRRARAGPTRSAASLQSVPPATRAANQLAPEGQRQQPPAPGAPGSGHRPDYCR